MKKKAVTSQGVLVESALLVARAQTCMKLAEALRQEGNEASAMMLGNAVESVLSAMVARDLCNQFMVLPEPICQFHDAALKNF